MERGGVGEPRRRVIARRLKTVPTVVLGSAWTWRFQQVWAGWMFAAVQRLMGLRVEVSGDDVLGDGPVIVLVRHASIVDNLLPSVLVARAHRVHLRYVLKRELLSDPCLDVAGRRLPNYFVRRDTGEEVERDNVRRLAGGLAPQDGVLLYPEGTRFTSERRERAIERIAVRDPQRARRVQQIEHLLPPKVGGFLAAARTRGTRRCARVTASAGRDVHCGRSSGRRDC